MGEPSLSGASGGSAPPEPPRRVGGAAPGARFTFAELPKAPELPPPRSNAPPAAAPPASAAPPSAASSSTLDKRKAAQQRTRSGLDGSAPARQERENVVRMRMQQRVTRMSSNPQLHRHHNFLSVMFDAPSGTMCEVCQRGLQERPYNMCQRCTTSVHMGCVGKLATFSCENHNEHSVFEVVDRIDEALRDKVARLEALAAQLKDETETQEKHEQVMELVSAPQPQVTEEWKQRQKRINAMVQEMQALEATTYLEVTEMSDEMRRFSTFKRL